MTLTKTRRGFGLETLLQERPEELRSWVTEAPLRLVAAVLTDVRVEAKRGDIIERLKGRVLDESVKLDDWWDRVRVAIEDSRYFRTTKNSNNVIIGIRLAPLATVDDIPAEPLPPKPAKAPKKRAVSLADWKKWLLSDTPEPPPGRWPTKPVSNALTKWPAKQIDQVMARTMWGAEGFLKGGGNSSQAAAGWLEAVGRASVRWIECTWPDTNSNLAERVGELLERLAGNTNLMGGWLFLSGALSNQLGGRSRYYEERLEQQRQEQDRQCASYEKQLEQQRQEQDRQCASYEKQLDEQKQKIDDFHREMNHLRQQIQTLNVMLASKREESRLDIRRDMLLVVGEAIQLMYRQQSNPEVALRDLEAGLVLALGAGGAQLLEVAGSSVKYDPFRHKVEGETADGTPVRVFAPGVIVPSKRLGDAVLLKALVSEFSGG